MELRMVKFSRSGYDRQYHESNIFDLDFAYFAGDAALLWRPFQGFGITRELHS